MACMLACLAAAGQAAELTAQEAAGKRLYFEGIGISGEPVQAFVGDESMDVPASAVPCASCHGEDGRGRPEGGVIPPDTTWRYLTKPYGHQHGNARRHPAFDEKSLARALRQRIDPAGNRLDSAMPQYALGPNDMAAIIAYLKRIETDLEPGLAVDAIRLGTILPLKGPQGEAGAAMLAVLKAYFADLNAQGGVYGRKLELAVAEAADTPEATLASARQLLESRRVFALVSPYAAGSDREIAALMERDGVPMVGAVTLFPQDRSGRFGFYLLSGVREQTLTLLDYAARELALRNPRSAVVHPADPLLEESVQALRAQAGSSYRWPDPANVGYPPARFDAGDLVQGLRRMHTEVVFFLGSGAELKSFLAAVEPTDWSPLVLLPGSGFQADVFGVSAKLLKKVLLAFPTLPSDRSAEGVRAFRSVQEKSGVPPRHLASQISAYCAGRLLVQGLQLAGRELSRRKLSAALEGLHDYDSGLTPPLNFGPNQHIGAPGAYIVAIDPVRRGFKPVTGWMVPK